MSILFYSRLTEDAPTTPIALPEGLTARIWRPAEQGPPPPGSRQPANWVWWAFDQLTIFARPDFAELTLWRGENLLHRLIITPRWFRFPFMDRADLQLGDLWTRPDARGQGLASLGVELARRMADPSDRLWYLVEADNAASIRLAARAGYRLTGVGRRSKGLSGRFRLERPVA